MVPDGVNALVNDRVCKNAWLPGATESDVHARRLECRLHRLAHALRAGWIEFWYQPKIDLRDRQIVGVEMFARARHPYHGPISAAVILQDASDTLLMQLAVFSLRWALQASAAMAQEGVRLPITLNMPAAAIDATAIAELLAQGPQGKEWRGLIFDVPKHDILSDYPRLERSGARLASLGIRFAADEFCGSLAG